MRLGTGATIAQWSINECVALSPVRASLSSREVRALTTLMPVRSHLSLVALLRPHTQDQHAALIDYNVATFRQAVLAVFDVGVNPPTE